MVEIYGSNWPTATRQPPRSEFKQLRCRSTWKELLCFERLKKLTADDDEGAPVLMGHRQLNLAKVK